MVTIYFKGGHTVEVPGAVRVDRHQRVGFGFVCYDKDGKELGRFADVEILGYVIGPEPTDRPRP